MNNSRKIYIDLIKIIAIFLVIVNHTNSYVFLSLHPSMTWTISIAYFYFSKVAVPLFIMSTGALMLGNVDSYQKHGARFKRMFIVFVLISTFYYYINVIIPVGYKGIITALSDIIQRPSSNALWYLYLYLSIIIAMPYLQRICKTFEMKDEVYFLFLCFLFASAYQLLRYYSGVSFFGGFELSIFTYPIGYLFAGHFIHKFVPKNRLYLMISLLTLLSSLVFSVIISYFNYLKDSNDYLFWSNISLPNVVFMSLSLFYITKYFSESIDTKFTGKAISSISACTFGIYLASDFVLIKTQSYFMNLSTLIKPFISCVAWQISIFIICFIIIKAVRSVPIVRRYI